MPIRPENKAKYPSNWKEISLRIREEAGQKCEWCWKPNGQILLCKSPGMWVDPEVNQWRDNHGRKIPFGRAPGLAEGREVKIVLTVAHLDHTPENCDRSNLRALCQSCHLTYDAPHKAEQRAKRKKQQEAQASLFEGTDGQD